MTSNGGLRYFEKAVALKTSQRLFPTPCACLN
ncbi:unnamed protein product, partial [Allacma fusca]